MALVVEQASLLMSVRDQGRFGFQRYGMPESGPMDWWAFKAANLLVGNQLKDACLEIGFSSTVLYLEQDALMAVCGSGFQISMNNRDIPLWMAFMVRKGVGLRIEKILGGNWCYLAVRGGIQTQSWMGSRSIYPQAGIGRLVREGDRLPLKQVANPVNLFAGRSIPSSARPAYQQDPEISVVPGPHQHCFRPSSLKKFWNGTYSLSHRSDRMGYRLTGNTFAHNRGADIVSQGMAMGEIQVPADGNPIVLMADHPTTGGYTCIGTVARVDLPLLAQSEPGVSQIHFKPIGVSEAQEALTRAMQRLEKSPQMQEDEWLHL